METIVYVKHADACPSKSKGRYWRRCTCRKWIYIAIERLRIPARTRSWERAEQVARQLRDERPASSSVGGDSIASCIAAFLDDKGEHSLSPNYRSKFSRELHHFSDWCLRKGIVTLPKLTLRHLEMYRQEWNVAPVTKSKRQERLRSFFAYCLKHKWVEENPVVRLTRIKVPPAPTLPLTRAQFDAVMERAALYNPKAPDSAWRRQRAIAMLLLLRWSGLRLGDASRLERSALKDDGNLRLRMAKTGVTVYIPLPPNVAQVLTELENTNPRYVFWNGTSAKDSTVKRWWSTLKKIFKAAGIPEAHPHMLRDTFAVECLLSGVPLDQVSMLLGHSDVKITLRHYSPWVAARQRQLEESVRKSWTATAG